MAGSPECASAPSRSLTLTRAPVSPTVVFSVKVTRDVSGEKLPALRQSQQCVASVRSWHSRHGLAESFHLRQVRPPNSKAVKNGSRKSAAPEQGPQTATGTLWAKAQMRCRPPSHLPSTLGCAARPLPLMPASLLTLTVHVQLHGTRISAAQALILHAAGAL